MAANHGEKIAKLEAHAERNDKDHAEFKAHHEKHFESHKELQHNQARNHERLLNCERNDTETKAAIEGLKTVCHELSGNATNLSNDMKILSVQLKKDNEKREREAEDLKKRKRDLIFSILKIVAVAMAGYFLGKLGVSV